jgi:hypothetical protein
MEMITTVKTTTNVVECCYLFVRDSTPVRGCRFIGRSFPRVAPVVIRIPRVAPVVIHMNPAGSDRQKQIAKRLNVNNHVCNAWIMNIRLTPTRQVDMFTENRMA